MSKWIEKWQVPSSSDPSKTYTVSKNEEGGYGCSCPAWTRARRECRHIRDVLAGRVTSRAERVPVIDESELLTIEEPVGLPDAPDLSELLGGPSKEERARTIEESRPFLERIRDSAPWRLAKHEDD